MVTLKKTQSKKGIKMHIKMQEPETAHEIREVFIGYKTALALLTFTIGGIVAGRSIWEYGMMYLGLPLTTVAGLLLFVSSGLILHKFQSSK